MACPICNRKADPELHPFCSARCADVDLARWLTGGYAIPSTDPDDIEAVLDAMEEALSDPEGSARLS